MAKPSSNVPYSSNPSTGMIESPMAKQIKSSNPGSAVKKGGK